MPFHCNMLRVSKTTLCPIRGPEESSGPTTYMGKMTTWPRMKLTPIHAKLCWSSKASTMSGWMVATLEDSWLDSYLCRWRDCYLQWCYPRQKEVPVMGRDINISTSSECSGSVDAITRRMILFCGKIIEKLLDSRMEAATYGRHERCVDDEPLDQTTS
jgi:hypothetical protein